jgi:hypothetical protein
MRRRSQQSRGAIPLAWRGDTIALSADGALALVPANGGAMKVICRSFAHVSGPASWTGPASS